MNQPKAPRNRRILIIDDNEAIHKDFRKILEGSDERSALAEARAALIGEGPAVTPELRFELDSAYQGRESLDMVCAARCDDRPYAIAFVDVRMPPGWNGIETARHILAEDPDMLIVICTAYSDHSWYEMAAQLGCTDRWLLLRKPFDHVEVRQMAVALTEKWELANTAAMRCVELKRMALERTQQIQRIQQQLYHSQKLQAISTLADGVAHEFDDLLQTIVDYSQAAIAAHGPSGSGLEDLRQVVSAAQKAAALTNQLMTFSRRKSVEVADVNPADVISSLLRMFTPIMAEGIELRTSFDGRVGTVRADATLMQQMLMNLCINAQDAMHDGGTITITTERANIRENDSRLQPGIQPGEYAMLSVADTGCGMSPDLRRRIFEPFFSTKKDGQGVGLGLSTVYGIMEEHGGVVGVDSELGTGSTFTLYFPIAAQLRRLPPQARPPASEVETSDPVLACDAQ